MEWMPLVRADQSDAIISFHLLRIFVTAILIYEHHSSAGNWMFCRFIPDHCLYITTWCPVPATQYYHLPNVYHAASRATLHPWAYQAARCWSCSNETTATQQGTQNWMRGWQQPELCWNWLTCFCWEQLDSEDILPLPTISRCFRVLWKSAVLLESHTWA